MRKIGHLSVKLKSESYFFKNNVPIEVRDSQMRLVSQDKIGRNKLQLDLPAGLYEVSAVLEDGQKHRQLLQIVEGEITPVEFNLRKEEPDRFPPRMSRKSNSLFEPPRFMDEIESLPDAEARSDTGLVTQLLEVQGVTMYSEGHLSWIFICELTPDSVPTALIRINDRKLRISLPISPEREFPYNSCVVNVEETPTGAHAHALITSERTVASALQNMLSSGYIMKAAEVADEAVDLLRYKYSDPTGAVLGALLLHRVGWLGKWTSWVDNLARDFNWLPDGKVLLAILLSEDESARSQALELALRASTQRMLYAESYSLLLDLLRRWSGESGMEGRQSAIQSLALLAPYVDWESICLSNVVEAVE